jgi:hypothetical protein
LPLGWGVNFWSEDAMRIQLPFALLFAAVFVWSIQAAPAQAQRVFVGATGSDSNPCTFTSPCRSFQHAHDVAAANGEIDVLDPAGYGALTISKAISIQGHGFSGISVSSSGTGITINAPATDVVHLNGLLIEGGHVGLEGIQFNSGKSLTIENCVVRNMTGDGLLLETLASTAQTLAVSDSYFSDNGFGGIVIETSGSGVVSVAIDRTKLSGNSFVGLDLIGNNGTGATNVSVTDSVAANNARGFLVQSAANHAVINVSLTQVLAEGNTIIGVMASTANATLWLAQSTVTGNASGFNASSGGVINSFGDNYFAANGTNTGSLTSVVKQ